MRSLDAKIGSPSLKEARRIIEKRNKEAKRSTYEEKVANAKHNVRAGKKPKTTPEDKKQYNFTDPESRIMKAGSGNHLNRHITHRRLSTPTPT